jgi:hypothetical protein
MSETRSFTMVCEKLESRTQLDRLEARGTIRLALKEAGLDPAAVTPREMSVVLEKILPAELRTRGIASPEAICRELAASLSTLSREEGGETPDRIFARLAGSPSRA